MEERRRREVWRSIKEVWRRKGEEKGGVENIKEVWRRGREEEKRGVEEHKGSMEEGRLGEERCGGT